VLARNRVLYVRKHEGRVAAALELVGVALGHVTHALACIPRPEQARGHLLALSALTRPPVSPAARPGRS